MLEDLRHIYTNLYKFLKGYSVSNHGGWVEGVHGILILTTSKKGDSKRLRKITRRGRLNRQYRIERSLLRKHYKRRGK